MRHRHGPPPRRHPNPRVATIVLVLVGLSAGSVALVGSSSWASTGGNVVRNPGFVAGTVDWSAGPGTRLGRVAGGHADAGAARLSAAGSTRTVALSQSPLATRTTVQGTVYRAAAWVRASSPGVTAVLEMREVTGRTTVLAHSKSALLTGTGWQRLTMDYTVRRSDDALVLTVAAGLSVHGQTMLVDDTWLSRTGRHVNGGPTPTPTPSAPSPSPSPSGSPTTSSPSPSGTPAPTGSPTATPSPSGTATPPETGAWPATSVHYAVNGNFGGSGQYLPGVDGFNLADVGNRSVADSLPAGVRALVWVGTCSGATSSFQSLVDSFAGDSKVFGFYLMDEPYASSCPPANLMAESDYVHAHLPGAKTFIIMVNMGSSGSPTFAGTYTPANSHLDLVGLDPYPVRSELATPDYGEIGRYVSAARAAGWPQASIVPVYQAFGGGTETDGGGGHWRLPTAGELSTMLADWAAVVPTPVFDYAYSWGTQFGDSALVGAADLQAVFRAMQTGA
jgi:Carbohydrate binding domain